MSQNRCRRRVAGLILGLGPAAAMAQDLPPAIPPPGAPAGPVVVGPAVDDAPVARPAPPVVVVPPGGMQPTWAPWVPDPAALERPCPRHAARKAGSWHWRRLQGKFLGYPELFEPRPLGASLYDHGRIMVANGAQAKLALYNFDFVPGSSELSPRGVDQLARVAAQLAVSPFPLIVERTAADPALAESRRYAVLARLARGPYPVPSERVLVGVPIANGLSGSDAQVIAGNALGRTQQYGPPIPINSNGVNSPSGVTTNSGSGIPVP